MRPTATRPAGAAVGLLLDRAFGEPPAFHPVAGFGTAMQHVEQATWRDRRSAGIAYTATGVALGAAAGWATRSTAITVGVGAAGRQLRTVAGQIGDRCEADDLAGARALLPSLVGRDPSALDHRGIAAAVIESLAENSVDAVVAPALWGAACGPAGAGAYRAVNTMDAMVGHRSERYERFGWSAARLDDVADVVPARAFAALVVAVAPGRARAIARAVRTQAPAHPSPNAGVAEAAVAAALGVELGGPLRYGDRHEDRPVLGTGPRPMPTDIARAIDLVDRTEQLLTALLLAPSVLTVVARRARRSPA